MFSELVPMHREVLILAAHDTWPSSPPSTPKWAAKDFARRK